MNWDALSAIAESIGAIGVIVTLVYLSMQIRQNTAMMRVTAKQNQSNVTHNLIDFAISHAEIMMKWSDPESLTELETYQSRMLARDAFRGWESYCYLREAGMLDDSEWEGLQITMNNLGARPFMKLTYKDMRAELSPRLRVVLDPLLEVDHGAA